MVIERLELKDFRNYEKLDINFDRYTNIIYGDNAQGKTNILEAIFLGATTKSHKQSKDKDIIRFGSDESHIRIELKKNEIPYKLDMHLRKNRSKGIAVNGVPIKKAAELLGILNIVFFSPEDLSIIKNGPSERRRFIDLELCQLDPYYLHNLSVYNKTVNQRNRLLKDMKDMSGINEMLDVYDEQLLSSGIKLIERRKRFIEELNDIIHDIHFKISGEREKCIIKYDPDVDTEDYKRVLSSVRNKDLKFKTTSIGPHRDDIIFDINGNDVRKFGSQGQQRTTALSLKLSEIKLIKENTKDSPVLLLDDVLSELDAKRQNFLLESIVDIQTVITCTGLDDFVSRRFDVNRTYHIVNGRVEDTV